MKRTANIFFAASVLMALFSVQGMAAGEETTPELKQLLQELRSLRLKIERLELRIEMLERRINQTPQEGIGEGFQSREADPDDDEPAYFFDWQQHEMPWQRSLPSNDKGLYIFPGLDAPPLTPMDVPDP